MVPEKMLELKAQGLLAMNAAADARSARMLAQAFYKELRAEGFTPQQVIAASNELLELLTADLKVKAELPAADA
ncbi:hypothetical protein [Vulgatibacter sp.]|uniref:hypothetical protein n=1 Tax=Vulgatibacter sp. TaxID=1971226 RepID=UPI0035649106